MKKRSIITTLLIAILACSSVLLFACGNGGNAKDTYEAYKTAIETFKTNDNLFSSNTVQDFTTNFYLNEFYSLSPSGEKETDNNYIILNAIGLDFIEKYYVNLENLENKYDFSKLNNSIKELNESYDALAVENANLANIESTESDIRNGYFARYKLQTKFFIKEVYETAITLGDFFMNDVKITEKLATEEQTFEELRFYYDFQRLMSFEDLRAFFMDSCRGQVVYDENENLNSLYTQALNCINAFSTGKTNIKELSMEEVQDFINVCNSVNNERSLFQKSITKFSLYKFTTTYDNSIDAYKKVDASADVYYNQLFESIDNLNLFNNYIDKNVVA